MFANNGYTDNNKTYLRVYNDKMKTLTKYGTYQKRYFN